MVRENSWARPAVRVEEEVGRGEAVGAVWTLTGGIHDTSALCVRDSELVRMSKVIWRTSEYAFLAHCIKSESVLELPSSTWSMTQPLKFPVY